MMKATHLCTLLIALTISGADESKHRADRSPFHIIVDAGSTGSRLHVFESVESDSKREVIRRGSQKTRVPLADFARSPAAVVAGVSLDPDAVAEHLLPLFKTAAEVIPPEHHSATRVLFLGTAGMRLVEEGEQELIYDAVQEGLKRSKIMEGGFPFQETKRKNFGTFRGTHEGFFAAVTVNYLAGAVDENVAYRSDRNPLGALDMGGSSAQIVLPPSSPDASLRMMDEFYSASHLGYGVDPLRERLFDGFVSHCQIEGANCTGSAIGNPCAFSGYVTEWRGYRLIGKGDAKTCSAQIGRLISSSDAFSLPTEGFDPSSANFYAMSNYFFVLDSLRELSSDELLNVSWPTPSLDELDGALDALCSRKWQGDLEDVKDSVHKYTSGDILPTRCLEAVYIVNILRDGYGFDPSSRNVIYTYDIDGTEIEWTFGLATWRFARERAKLLATF